MTIVHVTTRTTRGQVVPLGQAISDAYQKCRRRPESTFTVVPTMISFFADGPRRYEITEADVLISD